VLGAPDDVASYWPIGEIASLHGDSYPTWVTESKKQKIDIDDTDVASGKERDYFEYLTLCILAIAPLISIREGMASSRVCNEIAQTGISRRFRKIEYVWNRIGEYPNYALLTKAAIHWSELVSDGPNSPLMSGFYLADGSTADFDAYDVTDINVIDAAIDLAHTYLDVIDADTDMVKVRIALESLSIGGEKGPHAVSGPRIDPARVDVWRQMALRKDDPDVSDRTAQYPNIEEVGGEKIPVWVRLNGNSILEPDPYLLTLLRPSVVFEHDNKGDAAGAYGAFQCMSNDTPSGGSERESFASYYKLNGTHAYEQFKYNQDADDPVELVKLFPHLIYGPQALQDSSQTAFKMQNVAMPYVKFEVPLTHFGENTLALFEETRKLPVRIKG
jgi:hypothetical protein